MKEVLANIKRIRKEQGIAQWRMAYLLHISKSTYTMNELGEAFMFCSDCMAKLYSFDGNEDKTRPCPFKKDSQGKCTGKN